MEPIQINRTREDLEQQYDYVKRIENSLNWRRHKFLIIWIGVLTILVLLVLDFTPPDSLLVLKSVSFIILILVWSLLTVYTIWFFSRIYKRNLGIKNLIENTLKDGRSYSLSFDEEKVHILSEDFKLELTWKFFKGYLTNSSTVFLFSSNSLFSFHSFSVFEIGEENLNALRNLARARLPLMKDYALEQEIEGDIRQQNADSADY
jgi:hypothetical protein